MSLWLQIQEAYRSFTCPKQENMGMDNTICEISIVRWIRRDTVLENFREANTRFITVWDVDMQSG
jgi:hypothetical protein